METSSKGSIKRNRDKYKKPCPDCETLIKKEAQRCKPCWGKTQRGANNYQWKGGRTETPKGYIRLSGYQDHPNSNGGMIHEHVLVMTQQLGRPLTEGESVHHKNKIKHDNRPENLELWFGGQPSGARVEDLVMWSRALLKEYGDMFPG